jgi:hypothetical protein
MKIKIILHLNASDAEAAELQGIIRQATQSAAPGKCSYIPVLRKLLNKITIDGVDTDQDTGHEISLANVTIDGGNAEG